MADLDLDEFEVEHDFSADRNDDVSGSSRVWSIVAAGVLAVFIFAIYSKMQSR